MVYRKKVIRSEQVANSNVANSTSSESVLKSLFIAFTHTPNSPVEL